MELVAYSGALCALLVALATVTVTKQWTPPLTGGRRATIDGLRGYLAFAVFLHHSSIFYFYAKTGIWRNPPSDFFVNLGQGSVALFFMITSFLFYGQIRRARNSSFDWLRLYTSRVTRLTPLYLFAMLVLFVIVGYKTEWQLHEPVIALLVGMIRWLGFSALGMPDLNGLVDTRNVISSVVWSLPYEWAFYFALPLLALTERIKVPWAFIGMAVLVVVAVVGYGIMKKPGGGEKLLGFIGGIVAVHLADLGVVRRFASERKGSLVASIAMALAYAGFPSAFHPFALVLLTLVFTLIAADCDLFGLLRWKLSRVFGEYAYSIYLLHGLMLYAAINIMAGMQQAGTWQPLTYWGLIIFLTPALIIGASLTFRYIELPAMRSTPALVKWLRRPRLTTLEHVEPDLLQEKLR